MKQEWQALRRSFLLLTAGLTLVAVATGYWLWGPQAAVFSFCSALILTAGFWITEMLIGVVTGVKIASPSAKALLLLGKLGWWAALFFLANHAPESARLPIAMGFGAFLLGLLAAALFHLGPPKISDGPRA